MYELSRALYPPHLVPGCEELAGAVLRAQVLAVEIVQDVRTVPNSVSSSPCPWVRELTGAVLQAQVLAVNIQDVRTVPSSVSS